MLCCVVRVQGSSVWIAMDYCAGGSLSDLMHACGHTFSERQVSCIMRMALQGLAALHRVGVIHRDIKGGNLLADSDGTCKLSDFGVSATINHSLGRQRTVIGTPHWMAPEVLLSDDYDELADVWGLGITAYELAIGEPPHAKLHSMRAALKIPQAAPPTLPDPHQWTHSFHDFLRQWSATHNAHSNKDCRSRPPLCSLSCADCCVVAVCCSAAAVGVGVCVCIMGVVCVSV